MGVLSTLDPAAGLVTLRIAPGRESEAQQLVEDLKGRIMIEPVPDVPGPCPETGTTIAAKYADKAR